MPAKADPEIEASRAVEPAFYRAPCPDTPNTRPREFQLAGVEYALRRRNCIIGDAPGLGKTAECVLLSNAIEARHVLVVCPASLRLNWEREIWRWSTIENVRTYPILKSSDGVDLNANYVIVSYDLLRNDAIMGALLSRFWDHLVLDEAHYLKDPRGNKRTVPICAPDMLPAVVDRITMATGTLLPNQPIEAYNAIRLLDWDAFDRMSLEDFRRTYYEVGEGFVFGPTIDEETGARVYRRHWSREVLNVPTNLDDFQDRLRRRLMVRRLKEQVLHELPPMQWHPFPVEADAAIRKALKHPGWKEAEKLYQMDPGAFDRSVPVDGSISTARRILGEAKARHAAAYAAELLESGIEKVVVAAWHHSVLAILRAALERFGLAYMDGSTSQAKKQAAVDAFQSRPDVRVILGQMQPLGEGWTLTRAQDVVFAEYDWVPGKNDQMLERVNRMGQEGAYTIGHLPVVPGTLDEKILGTAVRKARSIFLALDAQ